MSDVVASARKKASQRLRRIVLPETDDQRMVEAWRKVLGLNEGVKDSLVMQKVSLVYLLPPRIAEQIHRFEDLPPHLYLGWRPQLEEAFAEISANTPFKRFTDHLSDTELYEALVTSVLHENTKDFEAVLPQSASRSRAATVTCLALCDFADPSHEQDFLRYYGTERMRSDYLLDHPTASLPPHEDPPYDRDQYLPRAIAEWERLDGDEWLYDLD